MTSTQALQSERRRYTRYSCDLGVEVRTGDAKTGNWGTLADICLGGCYINTFSPLSVGTPVVVFLRGHDIEFHVNGTTVTFHPGVGMGVQFSDFIQRSDEARLKELIASLAKRGS
jgi:PilZ domain